MDFIVNIFLLITALSMFCFIFSLIMLYMNQRNFRNGSRIYEAKIKNRFREIISHKKNIEFIKKL